MTSLQEETGGKADRIEFQKQGAQIQLEASHLFMEVGRLLRKLRDTSVWTAKDNTAAASWPTEYRRLLDAWAALNPPDKLRPDWQSVARAAEDLGPLLQDVVALGGQTPLDLPHRITELLGAIGKQLAVMNRQEAALLEHEKALAVEERLAQRCTEPNPSRSGR